VILIGPGFMGWWVDRPPFPAGGSQLNHPGAVPAVLEPREQGKSCISAAAPLISASDWAFIAQGRHKWAGTWGIEPARHPKFLTSCVDLAPPGVAAEG
jgi:hypothetical protein